MILPDVSGRDLSKAEALLAEAGIPYTVRETAPPKGGGQGVLKVVQQRAEDAGLLLVVCKVPDEFR